MRKAISNDGTAIAYDQTGAGPPVILVGGAMGFRTFSGATQLARLLSERFTVINYDRRGRGDSGDTAPYAVEREVEDIEALIREAGGSAYVYGMSSGAALALTAAASGLNVAKLVLYEPPYVGVDKMARQPPADHKEQLHALLAADRRGDAIAFFITKVMGAHAFIVWLMWFMPIWPKLKAVAHTLPYDMAVMEDFSVPARRAASVTAPTLVIAGEKSPPVLQKAARAIAEAIPRARHRVLKGQSHNVSMRALAPVLIAFFES